jgi:NADPH:quinone reductase-like Zn-dependent oxidoreductase
MNLTLEATKSLSKNNKKIAAEKSKPMAVTVTAPKKVELLVIDPPPPLHPNQVRGRTLYSLVSPGTELAWNYTGKEFPNYPGYSAVFRVDETGQEITNINKGDILFCQGSHKSYQQVSASDTVPVPAGLDPAHAVIARLMGVSMTTLMTTKARPGDTVIVTGMGPIGYCAASIFAVAGYEVHAVEPNAARRALINHPGIKKLHSSMPLGDSTLKGKVGVVIDCSGHEQAVIDGCNMVRRGGEVVLVGVPWKKRADASAFDLLHPVFHNYVVLRSGWEWELPRHESDFHPHSINSGFKLALQWLSEGKIPLEGLIETVNPANAQKVYDECANGTSKKLFQIFDWTKDN